MYKNLERGDGEVELKTGETVEIPLSDTEALTSLLDSGYVGVDIKNIYQEGEMISLSDRQDLNPKHWTLILTKKS